MSSEEQYGYGIDIAIKFDAEGEVDLKVDTTGDIALVGGDGDAELSIKVMNAIQQINIRLTTPFNSLKDEKGNQIPLGSNLHTSIGEKQTDLNVLLIKSFVMSSIADLQFIDQIIDIRLVSERIEQPTKLKTELFFTLKEDTNIYFTTIDLVKA